MSRTYRKSQAHSNEVNFIKKETEYYRRKYARSVTMSVNQREAYESAMADYEAKLLIWKTKTDFSVEYPNEPYKSQYSTVMYTKTPYTEEITEKYRNKYRKFSRDGYWSESGRRRAFKRLAAAETRNAWRKFTTAVIKECDYDDMPYPGDCLGKKLVWSVW